MNNTQKTINKIGFYDSGLGGLFVMNEVYKKFPNYEYVFLADEKNLPYGSKTVTELMVIAQRCLDFLIEKEGCTVVVIACNTLSATVYETLEAQYKKRFPHVLLLDIITPTVDSLDPQNHYSIFGTPRTVLSHIYTDSILHRFPEACVDEYEAPELASLIEHNEDTENYIRSFENEVYARPHTCILACTHYGLVEHVFKKIYPQCTFVTQVSVMVNLLSFILHAPVQGETSQSIVVYSTHDSPIFAEYTAQWFVGVHPVIVSL
jgi:glutamate racemase